ncbi:tetratricopeptide repeat protein [Marilutibacter alkalisoli]|uniref:tetratricopeptide repeat protein n=1 Tax=Marilutibacter alkalisoli TaxID=2591633 RepID=UPI00142032A6|nr:sel1 repeat family protein [Lysobacter alkalisoli]
MNAVSAAWNRYVAASSRNDPDVVALLAPSSIDDHAFIRDAALHASPEQIRRLPVTKRLELYALRARLDSDTIEAMDGAAVARECIRIDMCGISEPEEGDNAIALSHVTLVTPDLAVGELGPQYGTGYQFGPELVRMDGQWKIRTESLVLGDSMHVEQIIRQSGASETQVLEITLARYLPENAPMPSLALLDRPLRDDVAARTRLNESWPDYEATYRTRLQALQRKAEHGEDLALYLLGTLYYSGTMPKLAPRDTARGLAYLEHASDAGHAQAAALVVEIMIEQQQAEDSTDKPSEDYLVQLERHARRAAENGDAQSMGVIAGLTFTGEAGIARNCTLAEEWAARAEDAGLSRARNERVWFLATCPIESQRDTARAMQLARHMIDGVDSLDAAELDTVAAAFAANGQFDEAVKYQKLAIGAIPAGVPKAMIKGFKSRLNQYARGEAYIDETRG